MAPTDTVKPTSSGKASDERIADIESQEEYLDHHHTDKHALRNHQAQHIEYNDNHDPETKRAHDRYLWKLDLLILPAISACYFFEYLDRGNVAVSGRLLALSALITTAYPAPTVH